MPINYQIINNIFLYKNNRIKLVRYYGKMIE